MRKSKNKKIDKNKSTTAEYGALELKLGTKSNFLHVSFFPSSALIKFYFYLENLLTLNIPDKVKINIFFFNRTSIENLIFYFKN